MRGDRSTVGAAWLALAVAIGGSASVEAMPLNTGAGGLVNVPVASYRDVPFLTVVRQQYDYSCGAAAVATLLTYHHGHPVAEREVLEAMLALGDEEEIRRRGFAMLEMKFYLESLGFLADGYEFELDRLTELEIPAIALIDSDGYQHFVVIKGVEGDRVLVGDPAFGLVVHDRAAFEAKWNGIMFLIHSVDQVRIANNYYSRREEWALRPDSPLGTALPPDQLSMSAAFMQYPIQVRPIR